VARTIREFLQETVSWHAQAAANRIDPPVLALKVTAGTGKTRETLKALAKAAPLLLIRGPVIYHAPTLELAREAFETFRELAPQIPSSFVGGRSAIVGGAPLCHRIEELAGLGEMVPSFQQAACKRLSDDGRMVFADCYASCRYQAQFDHQEPKVIFTSHAYLRWQLPVQGDVSLRIIDEAFWSTLQHSQHLLFDTWLTAPRPKTVTEQWQGHWNTAHAGRVGAAKRLRDGKGPLVYDYGSIARIGEARAIVVDALRERRSPVIALEDAGIYEGLVDSFADWEIRDLPEAPVRLEQDPTTQAEIIRSFNTAERKAALLRHRGLEVNCRRLREG
jgi:hypothetical protein